MDRTDDDAADGRRTPTRGTTVREWVLLDGNRLVLSAVVSVVVFLFCLALALGDVLTVTRSGPVKAAAGSLIAGTITLVTVVLAINQLVLSDEFGTPGTLDDRFEEMRDFRRKVEEQTNVDATPAAPKAFLRVLFWNLLERVTDLREISEERHEPDVHEEVVAYTDDITTQARRASDILERSEFGTFGSLTSILDYDVSKQLYVANYLRNARSDAISKGANRTLDDIEALLKFIDVSRQYFKTVYTERELAGLSRVLLYVGFPAVLVPVVTVLTADRFLARAGELTFSVGVSAFVAVSLLPLTVLFAYVLRIATVAYRTASFGPFIPREEQAEDDVTGGFDVELGRDEE